MNYIGSKLSLSDFLLSTIQATVGNISDAVFCDIFAGTGIVGKTFKPLVKTVISNDTEHFSYVLNKNYIENNLPFEHHELVQELDALKPFCGFIYQHYSFEGSAQRGYFSGENAMKIDAIRTTIEHWKRSKRISSQQYYFLLATLLEAADKIANTASTYGAYLKNLKKLASKPLTLIPAHFEVAGVEHQAYQKDANELIAELRGDILYLDPPYNGRQYGANYHLLNTISLYDNFVPKGKTGQRNYFRSRYCNKAKVMHSLEELIAKAQFKYLFLSYNNEGFMPASDIQAMMQKYGHYTLATTQYQRFKAHKSESNNQKVRFTMESLHILKKH